MKHLCAVKGGTVIADLPDANLSCSLGLVGEGSALPLSLVPKICTGRAFDHLAAIEPFMVVTSKDASVLLVSWSSCHVRLH